jgi:hypothetical protein
MRALRSVLLMMICISCIDRYTPPLNEDTSRFLVVDGYLNADGTAAVHLARSVPLTHANFFPSEHDAVVTIETASGKTFDLIEGDSATYTASNLDFDADDHFTLHIKTKDGHEYQSDEVQSYPTPPVDNITWNITNARDLLEIRVDATDPNPDATGLYLWDCIETYQYHAAVFSGWKLVNGQPFEREPDEIYYMCWRDVTRPSVILNANYLTDNVISKFAVARLEKGGTELMIRYSLLVKQRAISEAEYAFRTQLQSSTEQQGTLFSVIPGTVVGNVHSITDPGEYVLGYFRAQDIKERRIFIDYKDLPKDFQIVKGIPSDCEPRKTCPVPSNVGFDCTPVTQLGADVLITSANTNGAGVISSYNWVTRACGDCRYYDGTSIRPPFWE